MLKWIAVITMIVDHVGAVLFPQSVLLRCIGRLSFPIFAFLLVEGFYHTGNLRRYQLRLLAFALLSEIPYDLAFHGTVLEFGNQNIFFTLFLALLTLDIMENGRFPFAGGVGLFVGCLSAYLLSADYGAGGILMVLCFYILRRQRFLGWCCFFLLNMFAFHSGIQWCAVAAAVFICLYNGQKGKTLGRGKFFYWIYPGHLLVLYMICKLWMR